MSGIESSKTGLTFVTRNLLGWEVEHVLGEKHPEVLQPRCLRIDPAQERGLRSIAGEAQKTPAPLLSMNRAGALGGKGYRTLLIDINPQAWVTAWLNLNDGLSSAGTIVISVTKQWDRPGMRWRRRGELRYGEFEHLRRPSAVIPGQSRGALARNLLGLDCADALDIDLGSTRKESLLRKSRSYKMSYLDIAMAGGVMLLAVLMILRKKSR